jgi:hypothetical protein
VTHNDHNITAVGPDIQGLIDTVLHNGTPWVHYSRGIMHNSIFVALAAFVGLSVAQKYVICDNDWSGSASFIPPLIYLNAGYEVCSNSGGVQTLVMVDSGNYHQYWVNKLFMLYDSSKLEI